MPSYRFFCRLSVFQRSTRSELEARLFILDKRKFHYKRQKKMYSNNEHVEVLHHSFIGVLVLNRCSLNTKLCFNIIEK